MRLKNVRHCLSVLAAAFFVTFALVHAAEAQAPLTTFRDCADCPEMVVVRAGRFTMGSAASAEEGPERQITIAHDFAVGRFEVTRAQFAAFARATSRTPTTNCITDRVRHGNFSPDPEGSWQNPGFAQTDNHPAVCVNWEDAEAYVAWLNTQTAGGYRLLSDAEWEYAARAGSSSQYPWGEDVNAACANANGVDAVAAASYPGWTGLVCSDGALRTAPVGSYAPNAFGLSDMIGNVLEWVEDCREASLARVPLDGGAYRGGSCVFRVLRGGSWADDRQYLRSSGRVGDDPTNRTFSYGFRVAKTL